MSFFLNWASIGAAVLAAVFWLLSAFTKIPTIYVLDGVYLGSELTEKQKVDPVVLALRKQARFSSIGASFAAVAALAQAGLQLLT